MEKQPQLEEAGTQLPDPARCQQEIGTPGTLSRCGASHFPGSAAGPWMFSVRVSNKALSRKADPVGIPANIPSRTRGTKSLGSVTGSIWIPNGIKSSPVFPKLAFGIAGLSWWSRNFLRNSLREGNYPMFGRTSKFPKIPTPSRAEPPAFPLFPAFPTPSPFPNIPRLLLSRTWDVGDAGIYHNAENPDPSSSSTRFLGSSQLQAPSHSFPFPSLPFPAIPAQLPASFPKLIGADSFQRLQEAPGAAASPSGMRQRHTELLQGFGKTGILPLRLIQAWIFPVLSSASFQASSRSARILLIQPSSREKGVFSGKGHGWVGRDLEPADVINSR